eukprot:Awhi_evm1s2694
MIKTPQITLPIREKNAVSKTRIRANIIRLNSSGVAPAPSFTKSSLKSQGKNEKESSRHSSVNTSLSSNLLTSGDKNSKFDRSLSLQDGRQSLQGKSLQSSRQQSLQSSRQQSLQGSSTYDNFAFEGLAHVERQPSLTMSYSSQDTNFSRSTMSSGNSSNSGDLTASVTSVPSSTVRQSYSLQRSNTLQTHQYYSQKGLSPRSSQSLLRAPERSLSSNCFYRKKDNACDNGSLASELTFGSSSAIRRSFDSCESKNSSPRNGEDAIYDVLTLQRSCSTAGSFCESVMNSDDDYYTAFQSVTLSDKKKKPNNNIIYHNGTVVCNKSNQGNYVNNLSNNNSNNITSNIYSTNHSTGNSVYDSKDNNVNCQNVLSPHEYETADNSLDSESNKKPSYILEKENFIMEDLTKLCDQGFKEELTDYSSNSYIQLREQEKRVSREHSNSANSIRNDSIASITPKIINVDPIRHIEITKKHNSYGVMVYNTKNGLLVVSITKNSSACHSGLQFFDEILEVNGKSTNGWSSKDVVREMCSNNSTILKVQSQAHATTSILNKPRFKSQSTLGIKIIDGIVHCETDSIAYKYGLRTGQIILSISNVNVFGEKDEYIIDKIRKSGKTFTIRTTSKSRFGELHHFLNLESMYRLKTSGDREDQSE